jgi:hypothetical protein
MKKNKNKQMNLNRNTIWLVVLFFALGCKKNPLDITPDGRTTLKDIFNDPALTEGYLNTAYTNLQLHGTNYHYWTMLAGICDEAHDADYPSQSFPVTNFLSGQLTPSSNPLDAGSTGNDNNFYIKNWAGIRQTNIFLENAVNTPGLNEKPRLLAEAKVLRAYYYFLLIEMYGNLPVITKQFEDLSDFEGLERNSFDENVRQIVKDCDEAIAEPGFPMRITNEPDRGRFTKSMAYVIKANALLFNASPLWNPENDSKKWQEASDAAKKAITDLTAGDNFKLNGNYETYFFGQSDLNANPTDKETIYEIKGFKETYRFAQLLYLMHSIPELGASRAGDCPTQELVDAYDMKNGQQPVLGYSDDQHLHPIINTASGYDEKNPYVNRDPRFYYTVYYNNELFGAPIKGSDYYIQAYLGGADGISPLRTRTKTGYYLRKYKDPKVQTADAGSAKYKVMRLAELYLDYAEAENEVNGPTKTVYDAIGMIRSRVGMPNVEEGLTKDQMRLRIRKERMVELSFEEHRMWDVRRWKIIGQTDKLTTGMEWTKLPDGTFTGRRIVSATRNAWQDKYLLFPIPLGEISKMPAFKQNPGW